MKMCGERNYEGVISRSEWPKQIFYGRLLFHFFKRMKNLHKIELQNFTAYLILKVVTSLIAGDASIETLHQLRIGCFLSIGKNAAQTNLDFP